MPTAPPQPIVRNEKGGIEILPGDNVQALSWGTWTFRWTLGFDVEPGGGMEIILVPRFPTNRWSLPQTHDPTAPGHVTARAGGGTLVDVNVLRWPLMQKPHGATLHIIQIGVGGRTMKAGETVEVTYGDKRGGSLGTQAQSSAREVSFPVFVAGGQAPKFFERFVSWGRDTTVATLRREADFNPSLRVVGGRAASFHVVAPMEVAPGAPFDLRVAALDVACNAATGYTGSVGTFSTDLHAENLPRIRIDATPAQAGGTVLNTPGFHRIYVVDPNLGILGVSNPVRVTPDPRPICWGEIHGHSENSDGNGTPDEHYTYARDVALLDFASVCDHDKSLAVHPERWELAMSKAREYNAPGRFVALLSYEASTLDPASPDKPVYRGDINVYYLTDRGEMLDPMYVPVDPSAAVGRDVLLIPHHPLYGPETNLGTDWSNLEAMPPDLMPLVEVFSTHGNSEYYDCPRHTIWQAEGQGVVDALKRGMRLGIIGSSDYHEVLTGHLLRIQDTPRTVNNRHMQARCGLAALRADELTRAGLFGAMKARRAYGTSGIRAYVDFSVNGVEMGGELSVCSATEPRRLKIAVAAPEPIVKLEIIRNGEAIADLADSSWHVEAELTDEDPIPDGVFYYVRVTTERTDFAWSSPVWVDIAA